MNFNKTKLGLGMIALSLSSMAFAGGFTPPSCTPGNVTIPCEKQAWDIGFTGMYAQATNNDLFDYQTAGLVLPAGQTQSLTTHTLKPDYDYGFNIQGSYHWGTGSDINLNWTHLSSDDNSFISQGTNSAVGDTPGGRFTGAFRDITSNVKLKHDAVNLEFGQTILVGDHVSMRFHAGGQWARVDGNFDQTGTNPPPVPLITFSRHVTTNSSKFSGIGPRLGMDANYQLGHGFSVLGRSAIAALVGDIDTHQFSAITNPAGTVTTTSIVGQKERVIVPSINADLGAAYTHPMTQGDLSIEAGYRVAAILHSVRWANSAGIFGNAIGGLTGNEVSNFGYHGPYATIKWLGSLA